MSDFDRFIGVWELEEIEDEDFSEGKRGGRPAVGFENPVGLLIYLASGEMSVNFAGSSRIPFLREFSPSPSELSAAGAAYGGYAGRWELDEPRREVIHLPQVSFVPNRVGARVRRSYSFSENLLLLRPIAIAAHDEAPNRTLKWRRRATP
ncbi:MAG TPA: lipocalin-like domain-containing protein [Thermoanaerobaculia bacterium]|jgi:hypothetical protein